MFLGIWVKSEEQAVRQSCEDIIKTYIDSCMTWRQYGFIYLVIFQLYDSVMFAQDKISEL